MARLFGTDGIRGVANEALTGLLAFQVGQAAADVLTEQSRGKPLILIGKDTRISSDMLEAALAAGICSVGGDVLLLGTAPTPAVAYLTVALGADAGIVISASHNSYEHNGIKIFNGEGYKLSDELEDRIEERMREGEFALKSYDAIGHIKSDFSALDRYIDHLAAAAESDYNGLRILVDCANGAASKTAEKLFSKFRADVVITHSAPDGININDDCGSTHMEELRRRVPAEKFDLGIAFDGDADRCLIVNEKGDLVDGDYIMAAIGAFLKQEGRLKNDTIVATVMSNLGFHLFAKENGIRVITAAVGDRYVLEEMRKGGYILGGEQSGHLIFLEESTTGDGQLTAIKYLNMLKKSGVTASTLHEGIKSYPQVLKNLRISAEKKSGVLSAEPVVNAIRNGEERLGGSGRVLVRLSGTEPLVRVMVEGVDEALVLEVCDDIAMSIQGV